LPFAEIAHNSEFFLFDIRGIVRNDVIEQNGLSIAAFAALILIIHLVALFMYKKRIRQMRILVFAILLMLGLFGMFYFFTYYSFSGAEISFKITVVFPLVAIILDYLAIRNIGKDEALVRSIDRIR
jgi:intracellular septation protein A